MSWFPLGYRQGQNYYVSLAGNDSNDGKTPATSWLTCAKVNATTFSAGDTVNFNGGDNFSGTLTFAWNGNIPNSIAALPFTIQSYGVGQATITANNPGVNAPPLGPRSWCIKCDGINGIVVNNLNIVGSGYTTATQYGVYLTNSSSVVNSNVTVKNCNISGFAVVGSSLHQGDFAIGININGFPSSGGHPGTDTINILNNTIFGTAGVTSLDDIGVGGFGFGQNISNVTYQGNLIYNLGSQIGVTAGISTFALNAMIQFNIIHDVGANNTSCGGPAGIEPFQSQAGTIQFNEVYKVQPSGGTYPGTGCDWDGIDLDGATRNYIVQYNYTHDNFGTGLIAFMQTVNGLTWGNNTIRYNISEHDAFGAQETASIYIAGFSGRGGPLNIYNNTVYASGSLPCGLGMAGNTPTSGIVANNIFYVRINQNGITKFIGFNNLNPTTVTFLSNCYRAPDGAPRWYQINGSVLTTLGAWQAAVTGGDAGAITSNPLLASPGAGGALTWTPSTQTTWPPGPNAYLLTTGSPCIGTGTDLTQAPYSLNVGTRDYFGNAIPHGTGTGYNMGADGGLHP